TCCSFPNDDIISHQYNRQGGTNSGGAETKDHLHFHFGKAEGFLCEYGCQVFGKDPKHDHHTSYFQGAYSFEQYTHVYQHAHADQEERNEEGITYKFDPVHEGRGMRNESVEGQTGHEGSDNGFQTCKLGQKSTQEN